MPTIIPPHTKCVGCTTNPATRVAGIGGTKREEFLCDACAGIAPTKCEYPGCTDPDCTGGVDCRLKRKVESAAKKTSGKKSDGKKSTASTSPGPSRVAPTQLFGSGQGKGKGKGKGESPDIDRDHSDSSSSTSTSSKSPPPAAPPAAAASAAETAALTCKTCSALFASEVLKDEHECRPYLCPEPGCNQRCLTDAGLDEHVKEAHPTSGTYKSVQYCRPCNTLHKTTVLKYSHKCPAFMCPDDDCEVGYKTEKEKDDHLKSEHPATFATLAAAAAAKGPGTEGHSKEGKVGKKERLYAFHSSLTAFYEDDRNIMNTLLKHGLLQSTHASKGRKKEVPDAKEPSRAKEKIRAAFEELCNEETGWLRKYTKYEEPNYANQLSRFRNMMAKCYVKRRLYMKDEYLPNLSLRDEELKATCERFLAKKIKDLLDRVRNAVKPKLEVKRKGHEKESKKRKKDDAIDDELVGSDDEDDDEGEQDYSMGDEEEGSDDDAEEVDDEDEDEEEDPKTKKAAALDAVPPRQRNINQAQGAVNVARKKRDDLKRKRRNKTNNALLVAAEQALTKAEKDLNTAKAAK